MSLSELIGRGIGKVSRKRLSDYQLKHLFLHQITFDRDEEEEQRNHQSRVSIFLLFAYFISSILCVSANAKYSSYFFRKGKTQLRHSSK